MTTEATLPTQEIHKLVALHFSGPGTSGLWPPSFGPWVADTVLNKMRADGWSYKISVDASRSHVEFLRRISSASPEDWGFGEATAGADEVGVAVCLAALRAKGVGV